MKAVRFYETGDVDVLKVESDVPLPKIQNPKEEVLVKLNYSSVNFIDTYYRTGLYKYNTPAPWITGGDGCGVVEQIDEKLSKELNLNKGDRVVFVGTQCYAQYAVVNTKHCAKIPEDISDDISVACMINGLTGHYLVNDSYAVKSGDTVLVLAAVGGTSQFIVQLAKQKGAKVIGIVSSEEKKEIAKTLHYDHILVVPPNTNQYAQQVKELTNGKGVNVVYDGVGAQTYLESLNSLAPRGYMVSFGNASGPVPAVQPFDLTSRGSLTFTRPKMQDFISTREEFTKRLTDLFALIRNKQLHVMIHKTFDLEDIKQAHLEIQARKTIGKILLRIK